MVLRSKYVFTLCSVIALQGVVRAQGPGAEKTLHVSAAAEPTPALRYRFVPSSAMMIEGNAAPIYLRLAHELAPASFNEASSQAVKMLNAEDKDFSIEDAEKLVDPWRQRLGQIALGTRRRHCDWNYTLMDQREDVIAVLLPDAQAMRSWGRLLAVKARLEVAQKQYDEAGRTIASGFAFARHVGQGPFLINGLVGIAIGSMMVDQLERLTAAENSPNMYWAIASLPRPLVSLRQGFETEHRIGGLMIPELEQFDRLSAEGEWDFLYRQILKRLAKLIRRQSLFLEERRPEIEPLLNPKKKIGPVARKFLKARVEWTGDQVDRMSDEQAVVLYIVHAYREIRDRAFKFAYLPYSQAFMRYGAVAAELAEVRKENPGLAAFVELMPAMGMAHMAQAKFQRRFAALQTVEAIRMHLSVSRGQLPPSLDAVTSVPVPWDPISGRAFNYSTDGITARLTAPDVMEVFGKAKNFFINQAQAKTADVNYRITVRTK